MLTNNDQTSVAIKDKIFHDLALSKTAFLLRNCS